MGALRARAQANVNAGTPGTAVGRRASSLNNVLNLSARGDSGGANGAAIAASSDARFVTAD